MKIPRQIYFSKIQLTVLAARVFAALLLVSAIPALSQTRYTSSPSGSDVKIDGTSSLHDWEMEGKLIGGFLELGPGVQLDAAQTTIAGITGDKVPATAHIIIPVRSIHSKAEHLPDVMDNLMQEHLKEPKFPRIEFTLKEMAFKGPHEAGKPFNFDITGDLVIAGVTNAATFPISIDCAAPDQIKVSGTAPVNMPAYGVDPPAPNFGLGLMKTGADVKIIFDWSLHKK
jgi:polyisoprenoid-binding protein YceI